jgi:tetratricopeptide (TPR) repeat protein
VNIDAFFQQFGALFEKGNPDEVGAFLAGSIAEAEAENDARGLITILNEAAGFYRNISEYARATAAAERALALLRDLGYESTVPYGTSLLNAATAYRAAGDSVKALELFIASLAVLAALLPEDDYRLAGLYNNISAIHAEKHNYPEALDMLEKASAIMAGKPDMADEAAVVLTNRAMMLFRLDRRDEAAATLEEALAAFRRAGGGGERQKFSPQYAAALAGMGEASYRMGRFAEAAETYEAALEHIRASFGENRDYAIICRNCADACEAAGNRERAGVLAGKSREILSRLGIQEPE